MLEGYAVKMRRKRAVVRRRQELQRIWLEQREEALRWAVAQFQRLEAQVTANGMGW